MIEHEQALCSDPNNSEIRYKKSCIFLKGVRAYAPYAPLCLRHCYDVHKLNAKMCFF